MPADGSGPATAPAKALVQFVQAIVSPTFPFVLVSLCAVSYLLASGLQSPEFGLWGLLGLWALAYARAHIWGAIVLVLAVLASLPLAWLAGRGRDAGSGRMLGEWVIAAVAFAGAFWLRRAWPFYGSDIQVFAYSFLLFVGWSALVEAAVDTAALIGVRRRAGRGC